MYNVFVGENDKMFDPIREKEYGYIFGNSNGMQISIYLFSGEDIIKTIDLYNGGAFGDFGFNLDDSDIENDKLDTNSFVIEKHNLLYNSFDNLLGDQEQLIIDDDFTQVSEAKFLQIRKEKEKIILEFHNHKNKMSSIDKFYVGIKNTLRDLRSKVDQQEVDTKSRLLIFFNEAFSVLKLYNPNTEHSVQLKKTIL